MNVGQKLKNARLAVNLTQEVVAEKIGISRQTLSSWENNKSYPDIVSTISLSDLYAISLDELLKGDDKMIEHLEKSTDTVGARQKFTKLFLVISYLVIWALSIIIFWLGGNYDAMGYALVAFYLVLPVSTLVISFFIGKDEGWAHTKWLMLLFFGFMFMLAPYATFSLANMTTFEQFYLPDITAALPGIICSAVGMAVGTLVKRITAKSSR